MVLTSKKIHASVTIVILANVALLAASARADSITVLEHSFEGAKTLAGWTGGGAAPGNSTASVPSPWVKTGTGFGSGWTASSQYSGGIPDGDIYAYANGGTNINQTLAALLQADTVYTLTVGVGWRKDLPSYGYPNFPGYGVELWAGTVKLASDYDAGHGGTGAATPGLDQWKDAVVTYTSPSSVTASALQIRLIGYGIQTNYDNVRLTADPTASLVLHVNTASGAMSILGDPHEAVNGVNSYEISSAGGLSLDATGWSSLADQNDVAGGFPAGDGTGNGWEEVGGVGPHALSERYLLGGSTFAAGASVGLGFGYDESVDARDLTFRYSTSSGDVFNGIVQYFVPVADANGDGVVDAADYIILKRHMGQATGAGEADGDFNDSGTTDWADLQILTGAMNGSAGGMIPEPATLALLAFGGLAVTRRRQK